MSCKTFSHIALKMKSSRISILNEIPPEKNWYGNINQNDKFAYNIYALDIRHLLSTLFSNEIVATTKSFELQSCKSHNHSVCSLSCFMIGIHCNTPILKSTLNSVLFIFLIFLRYENKLRHSENFHCSIWDATNFVPMVFCVAYNLVAPTTTVVENVLLFTWYVSFLFDYSWDDVKNVIVHYVVLESTILLGGPSTV